MYKGKRILSIIPARGGSKGIPHKNIVSLCGHPLIYYTINAGLQSKYIDYLMVSTDDDEIATVSKRCGAEVPFMRPACLATDTSKTIDAVLHAINALEEKGKNFDLLVLLQATQPLRDTNDIDGAIEYYVDTEIKSLASVSLVKDNPILVRNVKNTTMEKILTQGSTVRRQDMPAFYRINGCIYINLVRELNEDTSFNDNVSPYIMERSHSIDIDEESDLYMAEYYMKNR